MFKKVLVAEDFDSINLGIEQVLQSLGIETFHHSKYCDDALLKIKRAILDHEPYDLLISDLSFKKDHREVNIENGEDLIKITRELQPNIKIIVYSVEDKSHRIKSLFENSGVDSFVLKGRNSIEELKKTINSLETKQTFISPEIASIIQKKKSYEIDEFDILLLKHLSLGTPQDDIIDAFKELDIKPNSKSTIEKRISKLKDFFKANNTTHLISITKDMGIL